MRQDHSPALALALGATFVMLCYASHGYNHFPANILRVLSPTHSWIICKGTVLLAMKVWLAWDCTTIVPTSILDLHSCWHHASGHKKGGEFHAFKHACNVMIW